MKDHNCVVIEERPTDYVFGGVIPYEVIRPQGNWTENIDFHDRQKQQAYETDGCVLWAAHKSFDAQMNHHIEAGKIPMSVIDQFAAMGYMEVSPIDGGTRFHSSPRFLHILAGTKHNGTPLQKPWDVMRQYGVLPYRDLPFDHAMTDDQYFAPIPQVYLDKALHFLSIIGGKEAIQYHWVIQGGTGTAITTMKTALKQAPLCIGTAVCEPWDQVNVPTCDSTQPQHSTLDYFMDTVTHIEDNYEPFEKVLQFSYNVPYVMQGVLSIVKPIVKPLSTTPAVNPLPENIEPTQNNLNVLQILVSLYAKLVLLINGLSKGRTFGSTTMNTYPWWVSSTGQGVAQRIISLVALVIPILSLFGVNVAQRDVETFVNAGLIIIFAFWHAYAWARAHAFKSMKLGKYSTPQQ